MHVIGTAGHVDHGKSTLVRRLTGIDPDRLEEEKRRGLTIDLGFAWLTLPSGSEIGIVDVPGHERFIRNMLAGAGGISVCLFVVAANEGWKPQSAEHLAILDILGVAHGVVALTKSDTVDAETLEIAQAEVVDRLRGTSLEGAPVIPCSATTGAGIDPLLEAIDAAVGGAPAAVDGGRARLWVDRVFTIAGAGTVVTGTLAGGSLDDGQEVALVHRGAERRARVRRIQSHKKELSSVGPGNRVALNLAGMEREGAERGDAVVAPGVWRATELVSALVRVLPAEVAGRAHKLTEKGAHLMYVGAAETPVRIKLLGAPEIAAGEEGFVQLHLRDPLPLARDDRFVLRDAGRVLTFGGGVVLDPLPRPSKRNDETAISLLERLRSAHPRDAVTVLVEYAGTMDRAEALWRAGASETDLVTSEPEAEAETDGADEPKTGSVEDDLAASSTTAGAHAVSAPGMRSSKGEAPPLAGASAGDDSGSSVVALGDLLMTRGVLESMRASVRDVLRAHHEGNPLQRGLDRETLRKEAGALESNAFAALLRGMQDVTESGSLVALDSHSIQLSPAEQAERDRLVALHEEAGFSPPFAKDLGAPQELLRALTDSGELVRIGDFYLAGTRAAEARAKVRAAIEQQGPLTVAQIRDLLGTSRKYAVPLCEWLDSTGTTKRQGDLRSLGPRP